MCTMSSFAPRCVAAQEYCSSNKVIRGHAFFAKSVVYGARLALSKKSASSLPFQSLSF